LPRLASNCDPPIFTSQVAGLAVSLNTQIIRHERRASLLFQIGPLAGNLPGGNLITDIKIFNGAKKTRKEIK
jgi:hypothetical protein